MEKRISKIKKFFFLAAAFLAFSQLFSQVPSIVENIRLPVWAELDAYPELMNDTEAVENSDKKFNYSLNRIKNTAPFLIQGMVYGWNFVYTPSDKARNVEEYFEITPVLEDGFDTSKITYSSPWIEENKITVWCEYKRDNFQIQNYYLWSSIQNPTVHGTGYGSLEQGFDGITGAAYDAVKNGIREHFRKIIKNKPKEIRGAVLLKQVPTIGISQGRYLIILDFFLECDKIKEYTQY